VRVLAVGKTVEEKPGEHTVDGTVATLELSPQMAERLALAHQMGTLSLTLRSLVDSGRTGPGREQRNDSVVVYRGADVEAFSCTPNCDRHIAVGGTASQMDLPSSDKNDPGQGKAKPSPR
jgi:Flp pilus assembly protein CpaB